MNADSLLRLGQDEQTTKRSESEETWSSYRVQDLNFSPLLRQTGRWPRYLVHRTVCVDDSFIRRGDKADQILQRTGGGGWILFPRWLETVAVLVPVNSCEQLQNMSVSESYALLTQWSLCWILLKEVTRVSPKMWEMAAKIDSRKLVPWLPMWVFNVSFFVEVMSSEFWRSISVFNRPMYNSTLKDGKWQKIRFLLHIGKLKLGPEINSFSSRMWAPWYILT